jgi:hypothetical protein
MNEAVRVLQRDPYYVCSDDSLSAKDKYACIEASATLAVARWPTVINKLITM